MKYWLVLFALLINTKNFSQDTNVKVAFLADVHLQDIYGRLNDRGYESIVDADGLPVLIRTMDSQLHSTRIFNENYYAFIAALDDIATRGIKLVALPGDYTDDGQPIHLKGLKRILNEYHRNYGIEFFITTGNHDPVGPFAMDAGKDDFLGIGGKNQPVYSKKEMYSQQPNDLPCIVARDIAKMGYAGVMEHLQDFGFYPKENYIYWATPFSSYSFSNYSFTEARLHSSIEDRVYEVLPEFIVPDASYVVEPVEGLWLLAIDGNTYIPKDKSGNTTDPANFMAADLGFNNVIQKKAYLISWVKQVVSEAKKHNKTLIAFSHYPMIDFNDDASPEIEKLMGKGKWQLDRVPAEEVARAFADSGLQIHFGGHMHINDSAIRTIGTNTLLNIQTPSLAAYIPAYKLLTVRSGNIAEIETIVIDNVQGFNKLFPLYEMEYNYLKKNNVSEIWDKKILQSTSYYEFTEFHLKELVRLRFLPNDWKPEFVTFFKELSGEDLLLLAHMDININLSKLLENQKQFSKEWKAAAKKAKKSVKASGLGLKDFMQWKGEDLLFDFYKIRNADELAVADIGQRRILQYRLLAKSFLSNAHDTNDNMRLDVVLFFSILNKFLNDVPAGHFIYNMETGEVTNENNGTEMVPFKN